jgi:ATP-dependent Clp protease ATP-binding subunit ClpA
MNMATATKAVLDPKLKSNLAEEFESALRGKVVGQEAALDKMASLYQVYLAGLNPPGRPIGNLLFLGPTGSGKTRVVEAVAEALYGDPRAMIKIDCAEFQHSHEIAKLIGSPPGYLGHRETHPVLTQETLDQWHNEKVKVSILLLDEIEKASDALWQLLLGIMDKATLTLGDNRRVDLSQTIIFMTSNLGATEMSRMVEGGIGFAPAPKNRAEEQPAGDNLDAKIERTAMEAARRRFSPEFLNRLDQIVVFRALNGKQLREILDLELDQVQDRVMAAGHDRFLFHLSGPAKDFLLHEGLDQRYGARHLKRAIERHLVQPMASLVASGQVHDGDKIAVDLLTGGNLGPEMGFTRESEGLAIPAGNAARDVAPSTRPPAAAAGRRRPGTREMTQ